MSTKATAIDLTSPDQKYRDMSDDDLETDEELGSPAQHFDGAEYYAQFDDPDMLTQPYQASDDEEEKKESPAKKKLKRSGKGAARIGKSKYWLLTYPKLTAEQAQSKTVIGEKLEEMFGDDIQYSCVCRESHEDGTPHVHIFLQFKSIKQFRPTGKLDKIIPPDGKHGDYKCLKFGTTDAMLKYVKKSGDWIEMGIYTSKTTDPYTQAIEASTFDMAMNIMKVAKPRDFVVYHSQITQTLTKLHKKAQPEWSPPQNLLPFQVPDTLSQWVSTELPKQERAVCLVLIGDSRTGKTTWARTLQKDHIYIRGAFNLKRLLSTTATLLILDDCNDISTKKFDFRKTILTQMGDTTLTDKYLPKIDINVKWPAIVLANTAAEVAWATDPEHKEYSYWQINATVVDIGNQKLY